MSAGPSEEFYLAKNILVSLNQNIRLNYIQSISDLQEISMFFGFQIYYIISSLIISYIIARLLVGKGYKFFLKHINEIRKKLGYSDLSEHATVWAEIFAKYGPKVVEISKIDNPHDKFIGCLRKASRPLESDRNIVIDDVEHFTELVQKNSIPVDKVYIDTKSGIMIKIFDAKAIDEAQNELN